jgi:hypothetical protein
MAACENSHFPFQIKEAQSLFKEVDEEEYSELVSKRRQDDFVEDDGKEKKNYNDIPLLTTPGHIA